VFVAVWPVVVIRVAEPTVVRAIVATGTPQAGPVAPEVVHYDIAGPDFFAAHGALPPITVALPPFVVAVSADLPSAVLPAFRLPSPLTATHLARPSPRVFADLTATTGVVVAGYADERVYSYRGRREENHSLRSRGGDAGDTAGSGHNRECKAQRKDEVTHGG